MYTGQLTKSQLREIVSYALKMCEQDHIDPLAISMAKDGKIRCAWKNRALEIYHQQVADNYPI